MTRVVLVLLPAILTGHDMAAVGPQPTWHTGNVFPRLCVPRSDHHVHLRPSTSASDREISKPFSSLKSPEFIK